MATTPPGVETTGPQIVGTAIALPIIAAVFVGARVYTRTRLIHFFGIDDWCSIATLVVSIAYSVCLSIWTRHGGGMHIWDFNEPLEEEYYKWIMISSEFYALALLGYKTAILLLYIRLFSINRRFKIACYVVMAFNAGYLLSNIILQIFSCMPIEKFYQKKLPGHCVSLIPPDIAWGAMSMVSDFAIAILPIPVVWRLKLTRREKILVSLVFLSGLIAFVMALVRWILATIDLTTYDRTWIAGYAFLFSIVEVNTGIICGCTATLKPLFRFAREASSRRRSSTGARYEKGRGWGGSSSGEDTKRHPLRAPPGTMDRSKNKSVNTNDSQNSSIDIDLPMSKATTARPSIADAHDTTHFSNDLLNLPIEGATEPKPSKPHKKAHELGTMAPQILPTRRDVHEMAVAAPPALPSQRHAQELGTRQQSALPPSRQSYELATPQQVAFPSDIAHELGTRQQSALPPTRQSYEMPVDEKRYSYQMV